MLNPILEAVLLVSMLAQWAVLIFLWRALDAANDVISLLVKDMGW